MRKAALLICSVLAALAAASPAIASAALTLEDTSGPETKSLPVGSKIKAIGEGTAILGGGGITVECNENYLTGEIVKNNAERIEITITDAAFQSNLNATGTECKSGLGPINATVPLTNGGIEPKVHWCIRNTLGKDTFEFFGRNCGAEGEGSFTFLSHITTMFGTVSCAYVRNASLTGTFTTETAGHSAATLEITGAPLMTRESGSGICPELTELKSFKLRLYTDKYAGETSKEPWDDAESTANPVWISDKL